MESKYDEELASQIMQWIRNLLNESSIPTDGSTDSVYETLKDGTVLCKVVNCLVPNTIPASKIKPSKMAFKCMETISLFLESCSKLGVRDQELFQSVDLWERQNLSSVLMCIQALARTTGKRFNS